MNHIKNFMSVEKAIELKLSELLLSQESALSGGAL